jgi:hypothetical protein
MAQGPHVDLSPTVYSTASNLVMSGLNVATKGAVPVARSVAQCNIEVAELMTRRAQALMSASSRIAQCKTPAEFAETNLQFWTSATKDYLDASQRIASTFAAPPAGETPSKTATTAQNPFLDNPVMQAWTAIWTKDTKSNEAITPRDYITFPDGPSGKTPDPGRQAA